MFAVIENYQDEIVLDGTIYIDETFFPEKKSKVIKIDGKKLSGISKNQYCISTGTNGKNVFLIYQGKGKTSVNKVIKTYGPHIKKHFLGVKSGMNTYP